MTGRTAVRGNLLPDARLATILFQNGVHTVYSNDRDLRTFEVRTVDPSPDTVSADGAVQRVEPPARATARRV